MGLYERPINGLIRTTHKWVLGATMNTKRIQIVLTIVGIMAFALMVVGCGDDSRDISKMKNSIDGLNTSLSGGAIQGATHELTGTLGSINEQKFKPITPFDYTGSRTSEPPKIIMSLKVNAQGVIEASYLKISAFDQLGEFFYEGECQADQYRGINIGCGYLRPGYLRANLRDKLPTSFGFIDLVSDGSEGNVLHGKASLDNDPVSFGQFQLTVKVLGEHSQTSPEVTP